MVAREVMYNTISRPSFSARVDRVLSAHGELGLTTSIEFYSRQMLLQEIR